MVVAEGKSGKLEGNGRVSNTGGNVKLLYATTPPLPLPAFLGSGRAQRRTRRFGFQQLPVVSTAAFSYN